MIRNPYVDLCLHVQAVRRAFEEVRTPLAPALGVAASLYTHQVANVLRVLTDVRVRHLLADEVGLGKTVQALMILNALRRQRPDLKALVVVPDRLVPQWRDEIMTRAHTAPYDGETAATGEGQFVRLAWEDQLRRLGPDGNPPLSLSDIDPKRYQLLIVDELHRLRADVQDRIVRASAEFEHVLVLTATPSFQRPDRHAQLFSLLEPERTTRARREVAQTAEGVADGLSPTDDISNWPTWAAQAVVEAIIARDREAAAGCDEEEVSAVAQASCAYRRVIRTRRVDYNRVLPRRRHHPIVVEPLGAEVDRQSLMWRYFRHLDDLGSSFDPVLLAKRVILSPPSLEQRVDFFRRKGHERAGLLEKVKPLVHKSQGDSRLDALVDLLATVWAGDPEERVLVAAQDNLTVDYLFDFVQARLPEIGPLRARTNLVAARIRQGMTTDAVDDLAGFGNETNENLEAFQRGEAQVLFAPEAAQVGLNLQCARVLVLYSVPWRPEEVEQWIGRLDRIGNAAAFSNGGEAKNIEVFTIAQRGLVDEKVVTILERFRVFERSVNLDGDHIGELTQLIEDAALRPERVSWRDLEEASEAMAAEDELQELASALRPHLPWDVSWAAATRKRLDSLPPAPPLLVPLRDQSSTGPGAWDRALEPMLKLLDRSGDYSLRGNRDPETGDRFRTLWYRFGETGIYGKKPVTAKVVFSVGADPAHERSPKHAHAFITRRADIASPPRREVALVLDREKVRRPLRFMSFGDALHDELIEGWSTRAAQPVALEVGYFDDHELWKHGVPGRYLVRIAELDAAHALSLRDLAAELRVVAREATHSPVERLPDLVAPFAAAAKCALEADIRWLRSELTAAFYVEVKRETGTDWGTAAPEVAVALLNPMAHPRKGVPHASALSTDEDVRSARAALNAMRALQPAGREEWSDRLPLFADALRVRALVVAEERRDAIALAAQEALRAQAAVVDSRDRGNRAQITRAENLLNSAVDVLKMTKVYWSRREEWLSGCEVAVHSAKPREVLSAIIRANRVE